MAQYSDEELNDIYDRTKGRCHLCGKQLAFGNYGSYKKRGGWHVDHLVARARGGSDHGNNLMAACWECNLDKGTRSSRSVRRENGLRRAPMSSNKEAQARRGNAVVGGLLGGVGTALVAPHLWVGGMIVGAVLGHEADPED